MSYQAIAAHWNGACYSTEGEYYADYETLEAAIEAAEDLVGIYDTDADGEPCDVDLQWKIYEGDAADGQLVKRIRIDVQAAQTAIDDCEVVASSQGEWATSHVGTNGDYELVKWTVNGGTRGAYQGDPNRDGRDTVKPPEEIEALEWLRLAVGYGCDDPDKIVDAIDLTELEGSGESDEAHWIDAAGGVWKLPVWSIDCGDDKRLAWSDADGAGIDDVAIINNSDWVGFAESVAAELGEVVDVESGEHYTSHGVQYQHQALGDYDEAGYRIVIKRR